MSESQSRTSPTDEGLVRAIGTRQLGLSIINLVVGAGIFVLPGVVAAELGSAAILAYGICLIAVGLVFLCFAEAGSRVTRTGGAYAYVATAFGPFAGFVISVLLWFGWGVLGIAAVAVALADMLAFAVPWMGSFWARTVFLALLFGGLATVNVRGVKQGLRLAILNSYAKLVPLLILVVAGLFAVQWKHLAITAWPSWSSLGAGALILIFACGGAEYALNASGEIENPRKTVPSGLLLGLGVVFVLYLSVHGVAQGVLGPELAANTEAPLIATAERAMGPWGRTLLVIGTGISIFGVISGDLLAGPRAVFAAARDGLLPAKLGASHPRFKTPWLAIVFYASLAFAFALSGSFKTLAVVSSGAVLTIYLGCSLAVLALRRQHAKTGSGVHVLRVPGGPVVPLLSSAVVLWLLSNMTRAEAIGLGLMLLAASLLYAVQRAVRLRKEAMLAAGEADTIP